MATGFALTAATDPERLAAQWPVYDALYAYAAQAHP
jgi:hypothetical protein